MWTGERRERMQKHRLHMDTERHRQRRERERKSSEMELKSIRRDVNRVVVIVVIVQEEEKKWNHSKLKQFCFWKLLFSLVNVTVKWESVEGEGKRKNLLLSPRLASMRQKVSIFWYVFRLTHLPHRNVVCVVHEIRFCRQWKDREEREESGHGHFASLSYFGRHKRVTSSEGAGGVFDALISSYDREMVYSGMRRVHEKYVYNCARGRERRKKIQALTIKVSVRCFFLSLVLFFL